MASEIRLDTRMLDALIASLPGNLDEWLAGEAQEIVNDVVLSFNTSPAGRSYTRGSVTHVASQVGNPPNVDLETLRASIRWEKVSHLHFQVMDGVEYGIALEDGTERMGARPFMAPAVDARRAGLAQRFPRIF